MGAERTSVRHIVSIDDLTDAAIDGIIARARHHLVTPNSQSGHSFVSGLLFLSSSLRTRVGYSAAAIRLGGTPVDVVGQRTGSGMSMPESLADTLRALDGMVDLIVTRTNGPLPDVARTLRHPVINGGETGGEHPTQALIDLLAIEEERGDVTSLRIGLCGDLGARSVQSLLKVFDRNPPREIRLMGPAARRPQAEAVGDPGRASPECLEQTDFDGLDVLYMIGLPPGSGPERLPSEDRSRFALDEASIRALPLEAVVLSPMPVVDEIAPGVRDDRRIRMFEQSDRGIAVRMACIEYCLGT